MNTPKVIPPESTHPPRTAADRSSESGSDAIGDVSSDRSDLQLLDVEILERTLDRFWHPWIGVIGLVLIIAVLLANVTSYWLPSPDSGLYLNLGRSLAAGKGYQVDGIPHTLAFPGFPFMLAAVFAVLGENFLVMNLLVTLMGIGCVLLTFVLLRRWVGTRLAMVITLLTGMTEVMVRYSARILTDVPHLFFSLLSLVLIEQMWTQRTERRRVTAAVLAGVSVAITCMVRPNGLVLIPVLVVALFWRRYSLMNLRDKVLSLLTWIIAIGGSLLAWQYYVLGVDSSQRMTYMKSSVLFRGVGRLFSHIQHNFDELPEQLVETLARNHLGVVFSVILLQVIVVGLVRLTRRGAWHLTLYTVLGTGLLFLHNFQRRYLMAILPFAMAGVLLGTARLFSFAEERHPGSKKWRTAASVTLILLMVAFPLANAFPIVKLTRQKYQSPLYEHYDGGNWNDEVLLGEWLLNNTPPDTVFWSHYTSVISYLSQRTGRGPGTPYRGMSIASWTSSTALLRNLSRWKPKYLIVVINTNRRRIVEKLVDEKRIHVVRVHIDGLKRLRIYRFKRPAQFRRKPRPDKDKARTRRKS